MEEVLFCSDRWALFPHPTLEALEGSALRPWTAGSQASAPPADLHLHLCPARLMTQTGPESCGQLSSLFLHNERQRWKLWPPRASGPPSCCIPQWRLWRWQRFQVDGGQRWGCCPLLQEAGGFTGPQPPRDHQIPWAEGEGDTSPGGLSREEVALYLINY